jgi:hypothetical protein
MFEVFGAVNDVGVIPPQIASNIFSIKKIQWQLCHYHQNCSIFSAMGKLNFSVNALKQNLN